MKINNMKINNMKMKMKMKNRDDNKKNNNPELMIINNSNNSNNNSTIDDAFYPQHTLLPSITRNSKHDKCSWIELDLTDRAYIDIVGNSNHKVLEHEINGRKVNDDCDYDYAYGEYHSSLSSFESFAEPSFHDMILDSVNNNNKNEPIIHTGDITTENENSRSRRRSSSNNNYNRIDDTTESICKEVDDVIEIKGDEVVVKHRTTPPVMENSQKSNKPIRQRLLMMMGKLNKRKAKPSPSKFNVDDATMTQRSADPITILSIPKEQQNCTDVSCSISDIKTTTATPTAEPQSAQATAPTTAPASSPLPSTSTSTATATSPLLTTTATATATATAKPPPAPTTTAPQHLLRRSNLKQKKNLPTIDGHDHDHDDNKKKKIQIKNNMSKSSSRSNKKNTGVKNNNRSKSCNYLNTDDTDDDEGCHGLLTVSEHRRRRRNDKFTKNAKTKRVDDNKKRKTQIKNNTTKSNSRSKKNKKKEHTIGVKNTYTSNSCNSLDSDDGFYGLSTISDHHRRHRYDSIKTRRVESDDNIVGDNEQEETRKLTTTANRGDNKINNNNNNSNSNKKRKSINKTSKRMHSHSLLLPSDNNDIDDNEENEENELKEEKGRTRIEDNDDDNGTDNNAVIAALDNIITKNTKNKPSSWTNKPSDNTIDVKLLPTGRRSFSVIDGSSSSRNKNPNATRYSTRRSSFSVIDGSGSSSSNKNPNATSYSTRRSSFSVIDGSSSTSNKNPNATSYSTRSLEISTVTIKSTIGSSSSSSSSNNNNNNNNNNNSNSKNNSNSNSNIDVLSIRTRSNHRITSHKQRERKLAESENRRALIRNSLFAAANINTINDDDDDNDSNKFGRSSNHAYPTKRGSLKRSQSLQNHRNTTKMQQQVIFPEIDK